MLAAMHSSPNAFAPGCDEVRPSLVESNAWCQTFARLHAENFTVASWLLPQSLRQPFANVYAWCRWADDLADAGNDVAQNLQRLDDWEFQLHRCAAGEAEHPIYVALAATLAEFDLPLSPFTDLLAAFRQDQKQFHHYETFDELLGYCQRSANPVGRLVLHLGRCASNESIALSDSICTGLQLVNFWQDVRRDWSERRRIYLPRETMRKYRVEVDDIARGRATNAFRKAIAHEVARAEKFLHEGWPLVSHVSPALRVEVELFLRGGLAVADAIRRQRYDVLARRPTISKAKKCRLFLATIWRQKILRRRGALA
jgi:squalene synthase HpnC